MTQNRTLSLILPAFGAAIIAALAQIIIPIGAVPITLQTFAVGLVAAVFKPREATLSAILYLILGAIGLPVSSKCTMDLFIRGVIDTDH